MHFIAMYEKLSPKTRDSQKEKPWFKFMQHLSFNMESLSRGLTAYDDCRSALLVPALLDIYALPLRSKGIASVGARYKHIMCTNSKLEDLHTRDRPAK